MSGVLKLGSTTFGTENNGKIELTNVANTSFSSSHHTWELKAVDAPIVGANYSTNDEPLSGQLAIYNGATKLWGITESGYVQNPTQIIWTGFLDAISGAKHGGATSSTLLSTITTILNIGNCWNNTNHNFTCPISGIYQIHAHYIKITGTGAEHLDIYVNNSSFAVDRNRIRATGDSYDQASGTYYFNLSAGDYIDFREFGEGIYQGHNEFSIRYVG